MLALPRRPLLWLQGLGSQIWALGFLSTVWSLVLSKEGLLLQGDGFLCLLFRYEYDLCAAFPRVWFIGPLGSSGLSFQRFPSPLVPSAVMARKVLFTYYLQDPDYASVMALPLLGLGLLFIGCVMWFRSLLGWQTILCFRLDLTQLLS